MRPLIERGRGFSRPCRSRYGLHRFVPIPERGANHGLTTTERIGLRSELSARRGRRGVVQPANVTMMRWPLDAIPADWAKWRNRWEYGHAGRAGLVTSALGALTWSLLQDR
jgi:hypothetical protein